MSKSRQSKANSFKSVKLVHVLAGMVVLMAGVASASALKSPSVMDEGTPVSSSVSGEIHSASTLRAALRGELREAAIEAATR